MTGAGFGTETETMAAASRHVEQVAGDVDATLRTLQGQLAPLAGAWKGTASTAFQALMTRYQENADKLNQALRGISEQLGSAGVTYATEDEAQRQSMSGIQNALG